MRIAPNRLVEPITIYRQARPSDTDDTDSPFYPRLVDDPFAVDAPKDRYSGYSREPQRWIIAQGTAVAQEDRASVHRSTPRVNVPGVSFFNMYFVVRKLDRPLPMKETNFGSISPEDRVYLLREYEAPSYLYRHTIVYWHTFSRGGTQIFTVDSREGSRTSATLSS